jgi:hypothetical protein
VDSAEKSVEDIVFMFLEGIEVLSEGAGEEAGV